MKLLFHSEKLRCLVLPLECRSLSFIHSFFLFSYFQNLSFFKWLIHKFIASMRENRKTKPLNRIQKLESKLKSFHIISKNFYFNLEHPTYLSPLMFDVFQLKTLLHKLKVCFFFTLLLSLMNISISSIFNVQHNGCMPRKRNSSQPCLHHLLSILFWHTKTKSLSSSKKFKLFSYETLICSRCIHIEVRFIRS